MLRGQSTLRARIRAYATVILPAALAILPIASAGASERYNFLPFTYRSCDNGRVGPIADPSTSCSLVTERRLATRVT